MKDCRRSPPKQVTISTLMKEEIVFCQKYTFFGIWIGSPGIADSDYFRLVQNRADSDSERKIGSSLLCRDLEQAIWSQLLVCTASTAEVWKEVNTCFVTAQNIIDDEDDSENFVV